MGSSTYWKLPIKYLFINNYETFSILENLSKTIVELINLFTIRYYFYLHEGLDGGVWYSLFIKNLAYYSSH